MVDAKQITKEYVSKFITENKEFFGGIIREIDDDIWTPAFYFSPKKTVHENFGTMVVWSISFTRTPKFKDMGMGAGHHETVMRNWFPIVKSDGIIVDGHDLQSMMTFYAQRGWTELKPHKSLQGHMTDLRDEFHKSDAIQIHSLTPNEWTVAECDGWQLAFYNGITNKFWTRDEVLEITLAEQRRVTEYREQLGANTGSMYS